MRALGLLLVAGSLWAQPVQHVHWSLSPAAAAAPGGETLIRADGQIDPGWHLYSASSPAGLPASFQVKGDAVESFTVFQPPPKRAFDSNFNSETETYEGEVAFLLRTRLRKDAAAGDSEIAVSARFQTCSDAQCVPGRWSGTVKLKIDPTAPAALTIPAGYQEVHAPRPSSSGSAPTAAEQGLALFLATAFGLGLAAIFTPCVFPMIPITMSYFLNRESGKRDGVTQAIVFCLGIVVLFTALGLVTSAALGPVGVKRLGSSPWVNGFITALFIAFGLSLLGAFEITVPSSVLTKLNASSGQGGFGGTLLMGLTFSLSSFACVGPFVGTLLAASVTGGELRPLLGMATFAAGLALPFFLLALFPGYLKRLPRSGGWLARVKVVMGFLVLAASLKYLASVDLTLGWGLVTRERFLAVWIVLFSMAGLYLLGFVRLEGVKADESLGLGRLLTGMALVAFALSLAPGMAGAKLGDLDAYVPAAESTAGAGAAGALTWMEDDYQGALARARAEGKLVFIDFTGVACTNCHWMRANMLSRPEIASELGKFVLVELYTDRSNAASDANEKLLEAQFHTAAEPFYAIVDADGRPIATFDHLTRDATEYLAFLHHAGPAPPAATPPPATAPAVPSETAGLPDTTLDGARIDSSGKVLVADLWATWCVPCVREIPGFNRLHRELSSQGVVVEGIAMDEEGAEVVKPFLAKHPMEYPVALGSAGIWRQFGIENLPVTMVFDRAGKLVKRFEGYTEEAALRAAVTQALRP